MFTVSTLNDVLCAERRKTWIYDVPLPAVHHLRETLNAVPPEQSLPNDIWAKYDAPVLASAIKLWLLELDPPLTMYEGWEDFRRLYPTGKFHRIFPILQLNYGYIVGKPEQNKSDEQHNENLRSSLQKLPKVHLYVLDCVIKHLVQ